MTGAKHGLLGEELQQLLHPVDPRDVPTPGFPTHDALVAWARSKPAEPVIEAALNVLRTDCWPQQYAAAALVRALGVEVEGLGYGEGFHWLVRRPNGQQMAIEPSVREHLAPDTVSEPATSVGRLRALIAEVMDQLQEQERMVLTLTYYERVAEEQIAAALSVDESLVHEVRRQALLSIRSKLTDEYLEALRRELAPFGSGDVEHGDLAVLREVTAA